MAPVYFWREFEDAPYNFLSQWYGAAFTAPCPTNPDETMTFLTTEQYMMYHKAMLFGDEEIADKIMKSDSPKTQKALGRKVKGFDGKNWDEHKSRIVEEGNWYKFTQQTKEKGLKEQLLQTGKRELVEASPFDRIWGVGYGAGDADANRGNWGENLLGKALMNVRERLQDQKD